MRGIDLPKARDAFLLVSGTTYVAGYVVWAIISWLNDLKPLPALQGQYFVAGIPVIMFITGGSLLIYFGVRRGKAISASVPWPVIRRYSYIMLFFILVLVTVMVLLILLRFYTMPRWGRSLFGIFSLVLMAFVLGLLDRFYVANAPIAGLVGTVAVYLTTILMSCGLVFNFIIDGYPRIPQALGGAKPQCGQLDVESGAFSPETLKALGVDYSDQGVALTDRLEIFFQSSFTVIVGLSQGARFELDRGGVAAIRLC